MPPAGTHAVEVGTTEGHKQNHKHKQRQYGIEDGVEKQRCVMQCWCISKDEVSQCTYTHRYRQCPVFGELYQFHAAKIHKSIHIKKGGQEYWSGLLPTQGLNPSLTGATWEASPMFICA